jgi:hypothetical protein
MKKIPTLICMEETMKQIRIWNPFAILMALSNMLYPHKRAARN